MTDRTSRIMAIIGTILAVVCLIILALMGPEPATAKGETPPAQIGEPLTIVRNENTPTGCQEDDPCFDCATMGNHVCAAEPVVADPSVTG